MTQPPSDADDGGNDSSYAAFVDVLNQPTPPPVAKETPPSAMTSSPSSSPSKPDPSKAADDPNAAVDRYAGARSVPFFSLFRHGTSADRLVMCVGILLQVGVGVSMAAMNLVFGEMIDDLAAPSGSVLGSTAGTIRIMLYLAIAFGITAFVAMSFIPYGAARITNRVREVYVRAVLRQDMAFFDGAPPGEVVAALSEYTLDLEEGLSIKLGEGVQGMSGALSGLAVALYFSWQITLACLIAVPLLAFSFYMILQSGAGGDGMLGKEAYEAAANVADETLGCMTTVAAFNGEPKAAARYEANLGAAETAAIRQGKKLGLGTGLLWGSFYAMMGIGFWWGGRLVISSSQQAMLDNPLPAGFRTEEQYSVNLMVARTSCFYRELGTFGKGDPIPYEGEAFDACVCAIPWSSIADTVENSDVEWAVALRAGGITGADVVDIQCGCTTSDEFLGSNCVSAGRTICVFFSVMIGGFLLALIPPSISAVKKAQMAAWKLYQIIDRVPAIAMDEGKGRKVTEMAGRITIEGLHFQYPTGADKIFNDINLDIAAGETVALVGESGSGKSTIARLVSRFYDPQEGRVCIDGVDVRDLDLRSMRDHIGVVSQEPLLFDESIAANIARGKAGPVPATQEEIEAAARAANAHDFIKTFPEGFDTKVGARGGKLSGGQKQRVAIARALIRKPKVLVLDEATSALDNESEKVVQSAIDNLVGAKGSGITTIIIAHRLSTVKNADRIVVLGAKDGGTSTANGSTIVEIGSHSELMAKEKGLYKALVGGAGSEGGKGGGTALDAEKGALTDVDLHDSSNADSRRHTRYAANTSKSSIKDEDDNSPGDKQTLTLSQKEQDKKLEDDFKNKVDKKRLAAYTRPERSQFILGLVACFCTGMAFPTCGFLFSLMLSAMAIQDYDYARTATEWLAAGFGFLAVFMVVAQYFQTYMFEIIGERMTKRLRTDYFRTLLRQEMGWFDMPANSLGVLTSRLAIDVKLIRLTVGQSTGATVSSMTSLLAGVIVALVAAWQFALAFLATVPLLALTEMINWALMKGGDSAAKKQLGAISGSFGEYVQGIREVQSFGLETFVSSEIDELLEGQILATAKKAALFRGISAGAVQIIQLGVYALAFFIGSLMMDAGLLDYEMFMLVLWCMAFGASGMGQAANWVASAAKGKAAAVRVFELFDRQPPIDNRPWKEDGTRRDMDVPREVNKKKGEIEFRNVKFAYPTRATARVFDGMSLKIPSGQTAALIGSSGSGKSTVMALLERFYDPVAAVIDRGEKDKDKLTEVKVIGDPKLDDSNGVILVDGMDIRTMDVMYLRESIGLVGQEPVLFDATVGENIAFGKEGATKEEIVSAAKTAHAHDFISKFAGEYDYKVGTRGKKVSGGQKQRIAIARAVLKDPRILLLDEATSALDNESEKIVQQSLDELVAKNKASDRTTVIIAHRLSTVRNADCIYVLENSGDGAVVVESGAHDALMAMGGKYKALLEATMESSD